VRVTLSNFEGGVHLVGIVVGANVLESRLVFWLEILTAGLGKIGCRDGNFKKRKHRGDGLDGGDVEVCPAAKVADVPPEVVVDTAWHTGDAADKRWRRIGRRQVLHDRRGGRNGLEIVEIGVREGRILDCWRSFELWNSQVLGASRAKIRGILSRGIHGGKRGGKAYAGLRRG